MKFSKKSRYGLVALLDLMIHSVNGHVSLNSIAERNRISLQYLEQVFGSLRRAGIVKSVKGPQGGYLLNDAPNHITVADVVNALDGSYHLADEVARGEEENANLFSVVVQKKVVETVNARLDDALENLTLEDLKQDFLKRSKYGQMMYYI